MSTTPYNFEAKAFVPTDGESKPSKDAHGGGRNGGKGRGGRGGGAIGNNNNGAADRRRRNSRNNDRDDRSVMAEHELFNKSKVNRRGEVDISHLLNLSLPPRTRNPVSSGGAPAPRRKQTTKSYDPIADKESYLNVMCKFVLDPRGDYKRLLNDPDALVPMEHVVRIIAQPSTCPICLEDVPEAPRMLECGHMMCYPCLFRFMSSESIIPPGETKPKKYKECPLCSNRVNIHKAKPVTLTNVNETFDTPKENTEVVLRLLLRPIDSLIALPRDMDGLTVGDFTHLPPTSLPNVSNYTRVVCATPGYAVDEFNHEIDALQIGKEQNRLLFNDSGDNYDRAIDTINDIKAVLQPPSNSELLNDHSESTHLDAWAEDAELAQALENTTIDGSRPNRRQSSSVENMYADENAYFFFQTGFELTTKYFLTALDIRILRAAYGAFCAFPSSLVARVDNIVYGETVTPELRKRMKYLAHLPLHTPVAFLECDWRGIVADDVLAQFSKELHARRKKKKDRDRKDERNKKRFEKQEKEHLQAELAQEQYYSPYSAYSSAAQTRSTSANRSSDHVPVVNSQRERRDSSNNSGGGVSFASIASGEAQSEQELKELEELLAQGNGKNSRKKKKLVLLSNIGGSRS